MQPLGHKRATIGYIVYKSVRFIFQFCDELGKPKGDVTGAGSFMKLRHIKWILCKIIVNKIPLRRARAWPSGRVHRASKGILHTSKIKDITFARQKKLNRMCKQ